MNLPKIGFGKGIVNKSRPHISTGVNEVPVYPVDVSNGMPAVSEKKWIQGAIKKPGALHKQLGVPEGEKIPAKKLQAASKKGGKLGQRARLAQTLKKFNKKK